MRILNIIQCTNLGGMEQANLERLVGLRTAGHQVELLSLNPMGGLRPLLEAAQIPARGLPYRGCGGWRSMFQLRHALRESSAQALIMTGHHFLTSLSLGGLCRGRRLLAIHFHHAGVKAPMEWRLIYKIARHTFQAVTFPTDFIRREAEALYPPIAEISHTVRDPMVLPQPATAEERRLARLEMGLPPDAFVVGNAGWLIPRKRFDVFLRVAARIAAAEPRAMFLIAGDGSEREKLIATTAQLQLSERVRWLGWQQDLNGFYRALDLLVFNADWEALGRTPLEALGHGVPVVASVTNGGLCEVLSRPDYAVLLNRHNEEALAAAAIEVARQPKRALQTALAGRARLAEMSSTSEHVAAIAALLDLD